jgi:muramoyltetrapeptide carboxypeptidase
MVPSRLIPGDEIRIIAPSKSMAIIKGEQREIAETKLKQLGFTVTYGKNIDDHDEFFSNSIEARIEDLHEAFADPNVKGILTVIGGYNANQLLRYIDYELIKQNPKVFCGYSDITALSLAILKKTGIVTYSGPHFSTFGAKAGFEYTQEYFLKAVADGIEEYVLEASDTWSDDAWFLDQDNRTFHKNEGYRILQEGTGAGEIIGGNLCTMNLLQGTEYMPSLKDSVLFIEDDEESHPFSFDRDLQSILHLPESSGIKAIVIGRFQNGSGMTDYALQQIIAGKRELNGIPVIANANFGHVHPLAAVPIGGRASVIANGGKVEIKISASR